MIENTKSYIHSECGAVTVDWIVLTATLIGLSVAVAAIIAKPTLDKSTGLSAAIEARTPGEF